MAWHGRSLYDPIQWTADTPRRILQLTLTNALVSSSDFCILAETRGMCAVPSQRYIALYLRGKYGVLYVAYLTRKTSRARSGDSAGGRNPPRLSSGETRHAMRGPGGISKEIMENGVLQSVMDYGCNFS